MKYFKYIIILILCLGCNSQELSKEWAPLNEVVERNKLPGLSDTAVTTISPKLFVSDLDWFNQKFPEGSVERAALRVHEVIHALEQEEYVGDSEGLNIYDSVAQLAEASDLESEYCGFESRLSHHERVV